MKRSELKPGTDYLFKASKYQDGERVTLLDMRRIWQVSKWQSDPNQTLEVQTGEVVTGYRLATSDFEKQWKVLVRFYAKGLRKTHVELVDTRYLIQEWDEDLPRQWEVAKQRAAAAAKAKDDERAAAYARGGTLVEALTERYGEGAKRAFEGDRLSIPYDMVQRILDDLGKV